MTAPTRSAWARWNGFLFDAVPLAPMALARVLLGATMFLTFAVVARDLDELWRPGGLVSYIGDSTWLVGSLPHRLVYGLALAASLTLALGLFTRASATTVLLAHLWLTAQMPFITWGSGRVSNTFLLYFILSRCGHVASLDAVLARRRGLPLAESGPAWPMRLVQLHACVLYYGAAVPRLWNPTWWSGEQAFEAAVFSVWARFPTVDWMPFQPLLTAATWGTWIVEFFAPVLLWWPRTRVPCVIALLLIHGGMEALTDTSWWHYLCIAALVTFLPVSVPRAILGFLSRPLLALGRRLGRVA